MMRITGHIKNWFPNFIWNKEKALELLMYLFCFFPFTIWVTTYCPGATAMGSDTQPYAMLLSILIVLFILPREKQIPISLKILFILGMFVIAFGIMNIWDVGIKRTIASCATYISLFFIPCAFFFILKMQGGLNETFVKTSIWVWFAVGVVQKVINPNFAHMFAARQTTNASRGVVSLASEPSAYGFVCFFFILFALDFKKNKKIYIALLLLQIIALAGSTVTIIYIVVYIGCVLINNVFLRKWKSVGITVLIILASLIGLYLMYHFSILSPRMQELTGYLFTRNWKLLFWDGSLKSRFEAIQTACMEFMELYGLAHGFQSYRVMSGVGILLIECGTWGIIYLITVGYQIWHAYPKTKSLIFTIGFILVMFSAIPFSSPIVCAYIGYCVYRGYLLDEEK